MPVQGIFLQQSGKLSNREFYFLLLLLIHKRTEIPRTTFLYMSWGTGTETPLTLPLLPISKHLISSNIINNGTIVESVKQ